MTAAGMVTGPGGPPRRAADRLVRLHWGMVGALEISARSNVAAMRGEFAAVAAEIQRLRGEAAERDGMLAAERRRASKLEAEPEGRRAARAARIRAT